MISDAQAIIQGVNALQVRQGASGVRAVRRGKLSGLGKEQNAPVRPFVQRVVAVAVFRKLSRTMEGEMEARVQEGSRYWLPRSKRVQQARPARAPKPCCLLTTFWAVTSSSKAMSWAALSLG